ncbi:hypothetical protein ACQP2F_16345 [Actinoplanes sp. CA-030573]|uniref:hypothetical protein n=1 Tax=Actinoplanes sp. CA-030573 TaxID=3239898 RepID=UPI003D90D12C
MIRFKRARRKVPAEMAVFLGIAGGFTFLVALALGAGTVQPSFEVLVLLAGVLTVVGLLLFLSPKR